MIQLTKEPIHFDSLIQETIKPDCGGTVLFLGTVREQTGLLKTKSLTYEAYEPMAVKILQDIASHAISQWKLGDLKIIHRIGYFKPMEVVVAVIATASHRAEAFTACAWIMDEIKKIVPIWKEETDPLNNSRWIHPGNP